LMCLCISHSEMGQGKVKKNKREFKKYLLSWGRCITTCCICYHLSPSPSLLPASLCNCPPSSTLLALSCLHYCAHLCWPAFVLTCAHTYPPGPVCTYLHSCVPLGLFVFVHAHLYPSEPVCILQGLFVLTHTCLYLLVLICIFLDLFSPVHLVVPQYLSNM